MTSTVSLIAAPLLLAGSLQAAQPLAGRGQIPGDATSVQEVYENWTVGCAQREGRKQCSLVQQQMDSNTRQRALAFELSAVAPDKADGMLLLPFGLAVDREVTLQIDETPMGAPLHFKTCLQAGCVVSLAFDARAIAALKKGTSLGVKATAADGNQPIAFALPLKGFASAFDRTAMLLK